MVSLPGLRNRKTVPARTAGELDAMAAAGAVVAAALRAVREARNYVDYSSCGRRGKWGTTTARALLDDLTESYIRAIGQLYMERYHREDV